MIYKHGWEAHQFLFMIARMQVRDNEWWRVKQKSICIVDYFSSTLQKVMQACSIESHFPFVVRWIIMSVFPAVLIY